MTGEHRPSTYRYKKRIRKYKQQQEDKILYQTYEGLKKLIKLIHKIFNRMKIPKNSNEKISSNTGNVLARV